MSLIERSYLKGISIAICITFGSVYTLGAAADIPILSGSVKVIATPRGDTDDFVFELTVEHGNERFTLSTMLIAVRNQQDAIEALKKTIGWKGDYLFIRAQCGGGNSRRCDLDHIFAIRRGKLVFTGQVAARADEVGAAYNDGYFTDIYDKLETNTLTSHAGAPDIRLFLQEKE